MGGGQYSLPLYHQRPKAGSLKGTCMVTLRADSKACSSSLLGFMVIPHHACLTQEPSGVACCLA